MSKLSYGEVCLIRSGLREDMLRQLPVWELLSYFIAPNRLKSQPTDRSYGSRKDQRIIKNQAGRSLRTFVSGMMNGATPRARPWFNLTVNNPLSAKTSASKRYFSQAEQVINSHFQVSNLYRVLPMAYKDVGAFSNAAFAMLPDARYGFYFYPFAIGTYAFSSDLMGNTNMFTRDFSMTIRQVVETYAKLTIGGQIDWSNIPDWIRQAYEQKRYTEKVVLSQLIVPNNSFDYGKTFFPWDKKFQSYTWVNSSGWGLPNQLSNGFRMEPSTSSGKGPNGDQVFLKVSGLDYFPIITPRWEVAPEEDYGIDGPGHIALSDVMTLQEMEKWRLEAIAKLVKPPMVGHASMKRHQASILAGGITYVDDQGVAAGFKPAFELDPKLAELIQDQSEYTAAIKSAFYEDLFLMLSSERTVSHVSAREIEAKNAERLSALAPVLGQWDQDLSSKLIDNAQFILAGSGRMPIKPRELEGENIRPEYISTLAQAAKASQMASIERLMNFAGSVAATQQDQTIVRIVKGAESVRSYADYVGADPTLVMDEQEYDTLKEGVAAQQQAQVEAQNLAQSAAAAKDLASAEVGKGSLLDSLLNNSGAGA